MKSLEEIKKMMVAGDTAQADVALKKLLAQEPDNLQAKMLYGTCRQLLGDEETFKRIHDELAPVMERMEEKESKAETISLWGKYQLLWEYLIVAGLISAAVGIAAWYFGRNLQEMFAVKYGGAVMQDRQIEAIGCQLYAGPPRRGLQMEDGDKKTTPSEEDAAIIK